MGVAVVSQGAKPVPVEKPFLVTALPETRILLEITLVVVFPCVCVPAFKTFTTGILGATVSINVPVIVLFPPIPTRGLPAISNMLPAGVNPVTTNEFPRVVSFVLIR